MKTAFDEMNTAGGEVRPHYQPYADWLASTPPEVIARKREEADLTFHRVGITFAVYGEEAGKERLIPFDIVPRIIPADEWTRVAAGHRQVHARWPSHRHRWWQPRHPRWRDAG